MRVKRAQGVQSNKIYIYIYGTYVKKTSKPAEQSKNQLCPGFLLPPKNVIRLTQNEKICQKNPQAVDLNWRALLKTQKNNCCAVMLLAPLLLAVTVEVQAYVLDRKVSLIVSLIWGITVFFATSSLLRRSSYLGKVTGGLPQNSCLRIKSSVRPCSLQKNMNAVSSS